VEGCAVSAEVSVLAGLDPELQTYALGPLWHYAVAGPSKEARSKLLLAAVAALDESKSSEPLVTTASAAVELFHLATLAHDDVVDSGELRRGLASLPSSFGAPLAAAAGGLFFGRALSLFAQCGEEAVALSTETAERMCDGQMRELRALHDINRTPADYLRASEGKTAGMFWLSAQLGGMLAGADRSDQDALARYGVALGVAFQIIDDVLDIRADERSTGKPRGCDIRNGIYTLPAIYALEECPALAGMLVADAELEPLLSLIEGTHAFERASADAERLISEAKAAASILPLPGPLHELADEELARMPGRARP
jgi:heptaprenyl diphosphate synthase